MAPNPLILSGGSGPLKRVQNDPFSGIPQKGSFWTHSPDPLHGALIDQTPKMGVQKG